jgi:hypothetical protein
MGRIDLIKFHFGVSNNLVGQPLHPNTFTTMDPMDTMVHDGKTHSCPKYSQMTATRQPSAEGVNETPSSPEKHFWKT